MSSQETIYHYCNADVFMKIISNKSIRLSDITKSNDSMELLWITQYIEEIFTSEFDKAVNKTAYFKNNYSRDLFLELVKHYMNDFFDEKHRYYSCFVCCFSEDGDLLSQWRGYADDATGLSIGFNLDVLSMLGKHPKDDNISSDIFNFGKVIYDVRSQKVLIKHCAQMLITELKNIAKDGELKTLKKRSMVPFNSIFLYLFQLSFFMKNPFFKEEKEWRICFWTNLNSSSKTSTIHIDHGLSLSDIGYYNRGSVVIPYIDLNFGKSDFKPLKIIYTGPKCKTKKRDLEKFLQLNQIECTVLESQGTYR